MTSAEHAEYDRLTEGMEMDFIVLTESFMGYCEEIIFGQDYPEIKYFCYHLYNDNYTCRIFLRLSCRIEKLYNKINPDRYPELSNGFANLLIYLKEPIAREADQDYIAENHSYWRGEIVKDPELAYSGSFRKYLSAL
ncbi:hypothetical protein FY557_17570 [Chryseobacterium sp. SN22]|uniref:hypothetical protein n=1 Tax=Chryseobacterium sp. SN22 TaxID=2606431 RepID=UPI0011EFD7E8|nr:hypothetical protein [Chryseobacterium sp. SN22]KAA0126459.1 hypothetical protein FY557_17570 [Chryseobacterium sp. SN22]